MQALILAAGVGRRLGKLTKDKPKCMLEVNGETLIERAIRILSSFGINRFIIVVGYKKEILINLLNKRFPNKEIIFIENKEYHKTNNIYSLFLAIDEFKKDDTILLESDIIFEESIIEELMNCIHENIAVVDKYQSWMDGSVILVNKEGFLSALIPKENFNFEEIDRYYKTVNIYKFSKQFINRYYIPFLKTYIEVFGKNEYYEQVIKVILSFDKVQIRALNLNNKKLWYEIDTPQDLKIAKIIFSKNKYNELSKFYGGYWRFKGIMDFYYLSNPYFPTENFLKDFKHSLKDLINSYPSGREIQKELFSSNFNVKKEFITVGNGASEFIKILSKVLKGKFGIIVPTFDEYINAIGNKNRLILLETKDLDFKYDIDFILEHKKFNDMDNILLINPDNPSGNFIKKRKTLELLNELKRKNKFLILDESFIEFASFEESLLEDKILEEFPNLIIIKSLSKSYGIAGLRLGVLLTSNKGILEEVEKLLPIWNINSLAEYFLQSFYKYKNEFIYSCEKIKEERARIFKFLSNNEKIRLYPSHGNFFMAEVKTLTSKEFVNTLLEDFGIFAKDLKGKIGIGNKNLVRLAIRSKEDNDILIKAIDEVLSNGKL